MGDHTHYTPETPRQAAWTLRSHRLLGQAFMTYFMCLNSRVIGKHHHEAWLGAKVWHLSEVRMLRAMACLWTSHGLWLTSALTNWKQRDSEAITEELERQRGDTCWRNWIKRPKTCGLGQRFSKWAHSGKRNKSTTVRRWKLYPYGCYYSVLMVNYLSWFGRDIIF